LLAAPKYDSAKRKRRKYTDELDKRLKEILKEEARKDRLLGAGHKQKLTNRQIRQKLVSEGFDISEASINNALATLPKRPKEVFIRQAGGRCRLIFTIIWAPCARSRGRSKTAWRASAFQG